MFARAVDLEPGMWFRAYPSGRPLCFAAVDRVVSRFPGKRRVWVRVSSGGVDFVAEFDSRFQVIDFGGGFR